MDVAYMQVMQGFNAVHTQIAELQNAFNGVAHVIAGYIQTMVQGITSTMITDQLARVPLMQMTYELAHQHMVPHQLCRISVAHQIGQNLADATMAATARLMSTVFSFKNAGSTMQRLVAHCPFVCPNTPAGQYGQNVCNGVQTAPAGLYLCDADLDVKGSVFDQRQFALPPSVEKANAAGQTLFTPNPTTSAQWKWMAADAACQMAMPDLPNPPGQTITVSSSNNNDVYAAWLKAKANYDAAFNVCVGAMMNRTAITGAVTGQQNLQDWKNQSDNACQILSWMCYWGDPTTAPAAAAASSDGTTEPVSLADCQNNGISLDMYKYLLAKWFSSQKAQTCSMGPPPQGGAADNAGLVGETPQEIYKQAKADGPEAMHRYEQERREEYNLFLNALREAKEGVKEVSAPSVR